ncbi:hypothetical protein [Mesorhizobium sp. CAU 1732]|uniref:hypothetical protein n=1 Tax=Mesorhizobium sp. CAU 1732 TaxID=3140358 RepID=UPI003261C621
MLGTTKLQKPAGVATPARKDRDRSVQVNVSLGGNEDDDASRRLVRKIRNSITRTLEQEHGNAFRVSFVGAEAKPAPREADVRPARSTAPGCGAWWNF